MIRLLLSFCIIFIASTAMAQTDSVSTASKAVEEFHSEVEEVLKGYDLGPDAAGLGKENAERKQNALKDLKAIKWSQGPGQRRYQRVMSVFAAYTGDAVKRITDTASRAPGMDVRKKDALVSLISGIKEKKTLAVKGSLASETYQKETPKPVPSVDRPPHEKTPEGGADIWDR